MAKQPDQWSLVYPPPEPEEPVTPPPIPQISTPHPAMMPIGRSRVCRHCGGTSIVKARGLQGLGESLLFVVLLLFFIVPGIIYYIYIESVPLCGSCGKRV